MTHRPLPNRSTPTAATDRDWEQRFADDDLAAYPHRVEVRGPTRSIVWPDVCANCTATTSGRLRVQKAFFRRGRGRLYHGFLGYRVVSIDVPLCPACASRHRASLPEVSWLRRHRTFLLNPAHIATVGCLVALWGTLPAVAGMSAHGTAATIAWGLPAIFVFGIAWTVGTTWLISRPDRFEPRTETSLACDVSHDVGGLFSRHRHIYGFRNQGFAEAFERANHDRVWTTRDQTEMRRRSGLIAVLLLGGLVVARLLLWYYDVP
ncbi:MAG: hypothetical protein AB7O28_18050 [Vicinamibacterales bacterium]